MKKHPIAHLSPENSKYERTQKSFRLQKTQGEATSTNLLVVCSKPQSECYSILRPNRDYIIEADIRDMYVYDYSCKIENDSKNISCPDRNLYLTPETEPLNVDRSKAILRLKEKVSNFEYAASLVASESINKINSCPPAIENKSDRQRMLSNLEAFRRELVQSRDPMISIDIISKELVSFDLTDKKPVKVTLFNYVDEGATSEIFDRRNRKINFENIYRRFVGNSSFGHIGLMIEVYDEANGVYRQAQYISWPDNQPIKTTMKMYEFGKVEKFSLPPITESQLYDYQVWLRKTPYIASHDDIFDVAAFNRKKLKQDLQSKYDFSRSLTDRFSEFFKSNKNLRHQSLLRAYYFSTIANAIDPLLADETIDGKKFFATDDLRAKISQLKVESKIDTKTETELLAIAGKIDNADIAIESELKSGSFLNEKLSSIDGKRLVSSYAHFAGQEFYADFRRNNLDIEKLTASKIQLESNLRERLLVSFSEDMGRVLHNYWDVWKFPTAKEAFFRQHGFDPEENVEKFKRIYEISSGTSFAGDDVKKYLQETDAVISEYQKVVRELHVPIEKYGKSFSRYSCNCAIVAGKNLDFLYGSDFFSGRNYFKGPADVIATAKKIRAGNLKRSTFAGQSLKFAGATAIAAGVIHLSTKILKQHNYIEEDAEGAIRKMLSDNKGEKAQENELLLTSSPGSNASCFSEAVKYFDLKMHAILQEAEKIVFLNSAISLTNL